MSLLNPSSGRCPETSVNCYIITWRYIPKGCQLQEQNTHNVTKTGLSRFCSMTVCMVVSENGRDLGESPNTDMKFSSRTSLSIPNLETAVQLSVTWNQKHIVITQWRLIRQHTSSSHNTLAGANGTTSLEDQLRQTLLTSYMMRMTCLIGICGLNKI
jgi:hypothetical protein